VLEEIAAGAEHPLAAHPDFAAYLDRVRAAERAATEPRAAFVQANLRLVIVVARQYADTRVPVADLVQEGNLGLLKAVDRYDPSHGTRFSTYAGWWIRHMIRRAVANDGRTVRVPVHLQDKRQRAERLRRELTARLGRAPGSAELAEAAGLSEDKLEQIQLHSSGGSLSLDRSIGDEGDHPWYDVFTPPDEDQRSPLDELLARSRVDEVPDLLDGLSAREADVIRKRFGMATGESLSLREIAEQYGLTRERIRQIQNRALAKMRKRATA
jgi:RNA polymerase primary sigma factor